MYGNAELWQVIMLKGAPQRMMLLFAARGRPFVLSMGFVACSSAVMLLTSFGACWSLRCDHLS